MWTEHHLARIQAYQLDGLRLWQIAERLGGGLLSSDVDLVLWAILGRNDDAALRYLNTFCRPEGAGAVVVPARAG